MLKPRIRTRFFCSTMLCLISCILLVFWLYGNALYGWWCCDDPQILKHALHYSSWQYFAVPEAWRALIPYSLTPWLSLTYDIDNAIFGLNPTGYYAHNLLMISFCATLIYLIARKWVNNWYAFGGALLFLVGSPIMVASYQLMVRHYVEGLFFYLLTLWMIIGGLQKKTGKTLWLAGISFAIAATAKEVYLPLGFVPLFLPLCNIRQRLKMAWPLLLVMFLYVPWRWYMLGDIIGGYTPVTELGHGDLTSALAQFVKIPELLLAWPWYGVSGVLLLIGLLLIRTRTEWLPLLVVLPLLLLIPLVPLARQPGLGAGSDRYFIALWATFSIGSAVMAGLVAAGGLKLRLISSVVMAMLITGAWFHTEEVRSTLLPWIQEQSVQGKAVVSATDLDIVYLTPAVAPWYVTGITELQSEACRPTASDEIDLYRQSLKGLRILRYDPEIRQMADITPPISQILEDWRGKVRTVPLSVMMLFDPESKMMNWHLGPYEQGTYTLLPSCGRYQLTHSGTVRMEKPPEGTYRLRYDSPEGWLAYTPPLKFESIEQGRVRLFMRGLGVSLAEIVDGTR